ncbi:DUF4942 domain-containing protein [Vagococcus fluvialis]|uniref:DUF4942 domain-containing protein n=1 Tax=Vagococcus fluvialis TaxID=2738 RepID=UPI001D09B50A|nr:DUF4942 domain-containing protein [Vagococcus fluvialis]UDM74970.1 DUF4942 domain-containing protein [Vagococcus fluvialis]UDM75036.1 DUF4942 domain-containing protein [Vagococcus fluvialis]
MFNDTFYPSPLKVVMMLTEGLNRSMNKVLEPSAGKGDIAQVLKEKCQNVEVIEKEQDLCSILQDKGFSLVGYDFLEFDTHTEYSAIVMNPPFDNGDKHLIHAIRLAEKQVIETCEIRAIVNAATIENDYSKTRSELANLINKHNGSVSYHENLFSDAERKTNVPTAIVKITIEPIKRKVSFRYGDIVNQVKNSDSDYLETSLSTFVSKQEVQERVYDIKTLVKQYDYHVELIKDMFESQKSIDYFEKLLKDDDKSLPSFYEGKHQDMNSMIESLRSRYWTMILKTDEFSENLTAYGRQQIQKQIENASSLEITYSNIEMLLMAVSQNSNQIILDSCVDLFERITQYHNKEYSTNIHYYNGWNTNDAFKVNSKFIIPLGGFYSSFDDGERGIGYKYVNGIRTQEIAYEHVMYKVKEFVMDLVKMFRLIDKEVDDNFRTIQLGEFESDTFKFKMFKKGTVHFWVKDLDLLERFNVICGQQFNWIPDDEEIKSNPKAKDFMDKGFSRYLRIGA